MKLLFTGGMAVLVTMLEGCPDASPWISATLFRLTVFQDLPTQQVRLFVRPSTHASLLSWNTSLCRCVASLSKGFAFLYTCTLQHNGTLPFCVCIYF